MRDRRKKSRQRSRKHGFLTLEAMLGLTFLFFVFMALLFLGFWLWIQLRVEDTATTIVRTATRQDRDPGETVQEVIFDGNGSALIEWGDEFVQVTVDALYGHARAVRVLPREVL